MVRYKRNSASKRNPSEMTVSLAELADSMPYSPSAEDDYLVSQVSRVVSDFLRSLPEKNAFIFICRYYCSDRIADIAAMLHISERTVFRELTAMREELRAILTKEGYYHA